MKVTLLKNHTHAGVDHEAGAEIEVPDSDANWLVENEVATKGAKPETPAEEPVKPVTIREAAARFARE